MKIYLDGMLFGVAINLNPEQLIKISSRAGANGLHWPWKVSELQHSLDYYKDLLEEHQQKVCAIWTRNYDSAGMLFKRSSFKRDFSESLELAEYFESECIEIWPNKKHVYAPIVKKSIPISPNILNKKVLHKNLDWAAREVRDKKIKISVEYHPSAVVSNYRDAIDLITDLPPEVGITCDTFHSHRVGDDPVEAIRALGNRLDMIHLSASHRGEVGSTNDSINYSDILGLSKRMGFSGQFILQYNIDPDQLLDSLTRSIEFVRRTMNDMKKNCE